jgi:hypothetical protein
VETPTTYTVIFSTGEGSGTAPADQTVEPGKSITLPNQGSMTAPAGKTFAGWKTGETTKQAGESFTVNGNTSFVAQWTNGSSSTTTYTVSYTTGGGGGSAPRDATVNAGASITLPNQGSMTAPTGKTFAGWKTGITTLQGGASFTVNGNTSFVAQWTSGSSSDSNSLYADFYNYPMGRVDQSGLLEVSTNIAQETLLFDGTVDKDHYLGTISPLGKVNLKMSEERFFTILAVEKSNYEERRSQAAQFSVLTYYSNTQPYSVTVTPSSTYGNGSWVFNNNTSFWVQIKKADLSQNYAVIAPGAQRVSVPIATNTPYDYYVYFSKELKYQGKVIALVESTDRSQANTAQVTDALPTFTTNIAAADVPNSIKPAVMLKNNSNKSVRVYYANQQKTNGAAGNDLVIVGGATQLISGFEINDDTSSIEFYALAWTPNKKVPTSQSMPMLADKVYEITIPSNEEASGITVTEVDASTYYE